MAALSQHPENKPKESCNGTHPGDQMAPPQSALPRVSGQAQRHRQGKHLVVGKSPAWAWAWPSDRTTILAVCVSPGFPGHLKKKAQLKAGHFPSIPGFHHQDSVKSENLRSAQDKPEGEKPAQDVSPASRLGSRASPCPCARGVVSKVNLLNWFFWNLQKDPAHQRGSDPPRCAWQALLSILHESATF